MKKIYLIVFLIVANLSLFSKEPYESSYEPLPYTNTIFRNANIYDGEGNEFNDTDLIIRDGKIIAIGEDLPYSNDLIEINANGSGLLLGL